jgi:MFS family permease
VVGALNIAHLRQKFRSETMVIGATLMLALSIAIVGFSKLTLVTAVAMFAAGAGWIIVITVFNIAVQMSVPRWVAGRTIAAYQMASAGGIAVGSLVWGHVARGQGLVSAILLSAVLLASFILLSFLWPTPEVAETDQTEIERQDPEIGLALTGRSGPVTIEVDYRIDATDARAFYNQMQAVRKMRLRNGAFGWTISRDIESPEIWVEKFHFPTWHDYLRHRSRSTDGEMAILNEALHYHWTQSSPRVRRLLERPFGSVRWKEDAPDHRQNLRSDV